jgi:uncharacterized protein
VGQIGLSAAAAKMIVPLPILGAPRRWKVARPIHERPLTDDRVLLIHPQSGAWAMVRADAVAAVRAFLAACESGGLDGPQGLDRSPLFERFRNSGLIREDQAGGGCQGECSDSQGRLNLLILKLVGYCDLACRYCYDYRAATYSRRMSDEVARRAILESLGRCGPVLRILFHGGEPLLAIDQIRSLIPFAKAAARTAGRDVQFAIQTNGRHFTPETVDFLLEERVSIGVSLDGVAEENDQHRVDHAGRGHSAEIEAALRSNPRLLATVGVLTTVTRTNAARLFETAEYVRDLGITRWDVSLFQPLGRATDTESEFAPPTDAIIQSYLQLFDAVEAGDFDSMAVLPVLHYVRNVLTTERRHMCLRDGCGAAKDLVSIGVDGAIQACDCIGDPDLVLGKMDREGIGEALDGRIAETIRGRSTSILSPCQDCDWRSFCGGTCLARSGLKQVDEQECRIALTIFPEIFQRLSASDRLERYAQRFV